MTTEAHDSAQDRPGDAEPGLLLLSPVEALTWASDALRALKAHHDSYASADWRERAAIVAAASAYAEAAALVFDVPLEAPEVEGDESTLRAVRVIVDEAIRRGPRHPALSQIAETLDRAGT